MDPENGEQAGSAAKRSRAPQACIRCKGRKIRCDAKKPSCLKCLRNEEECVYPEVLRRRGPGRTKQHIQNLEKRLANLASKLETATLPQARDHGASSLPDVGSQSPTESALGAGSIATSTSTTQGPAWPFHDESNPQMVGEGAGQVYYGPGGTTLMANKGVQILFRRQDFTPWIDTDGLLVIAQEMLGHYAKIPMLARLPCFLDRLQDRFQAAQAVKSSAGSAYMQCLLALAITDKILNKNFQDLVGMAWPVFKNSISALTELLVGGDGAVSVQAVVAMAVFMLGTQDSRTVHVLSSSASCLSTSLGLHRQSQAEDTGDLLIRSRVFWASYILDKSLGLLHGLPTVHDDDDIMMDLPTANNKEAGWFRLRAKLAMVESPVRRRLYTAKGLILSDEAIVQDLIDLDSLLEHCRADLPTNIQNAYDGPPDIGELSSDAVEHFVAFYNCSIMTHWAARRHSEWSVVSGQWRKMAMPHLQLFLSKVRCRLSAQGTLGLLCSMPGPQFTELWRMMPYALCASMVLTTEVLENPTASRSQELLASMKLFTEYLQKFEDEEGGDFQRVRMACTKMQQVGQSAIAESHDVSSRSDGSSTWYSNFSEEAQNLLSILRSSTHPMYLVQGLLGNLKNKDEAVTSRLIQFLGLSPDDNFSRAPLAPVSLWPGTYNFAFDQEQEKSGLIGVES